MDRPVRMSDETYQKIAAIAKEKDRKLIQILEYAVDLYYKLTIGNKRKKRKPNARKRSL